MVCTNVKEGMVSFVDVKYFAYQMGCHESRIGDNDQDLRELMGTMDIIKEEVQKLTSMNQCSHCQETPAHVDHPTEETSVIQLVRGLEGKKK